MHAGKIALGNQVCLRLQPMLHIVPGQRTLILVTEIGPPRHLIHGRREIFSLRPRARARIGGRIRFRFRRVFLRMMIVLHVRSIGGRQKSGYGVFTPLHPQRNGSGMIHLDSVCPRFIPCAGLRRAFGIGLCPAHPALPIGIRPRRGSLCPSRRTVKIFLLGNFPPLNFNRPVHRVGGIIKARKLKSL